MPFPLAHPAAVLPLRRWCPQRLSLPALIIGSLSPDMGYAFTLVGVEMQRFSHQLAGIVFCLPAGLLALWVFHRACPLAVGLLPKFYQEVLSPLCRRPLGPPRVIIVSLLIGTLTHQFLDSFTHKDGWLTEQLAVLQVPLYRHGHRTFRVCHLLWYVCSFVGITWVCAVFQEWLAKTGLSTKAVSAGERLWNAALLAAAVMLASGSHYITRHWSANFVEVAFTLLILALFAWQIGSLPRSR
ncbi:MAG: DUF4184 family protein [Verrucomicrobia bacterium]|nr:DUF4184 family protein [Verrucomicrobiota bacterium]